MGMVLMFSQLLKYWFAHTFGWINTEIWFEDASELVSDLITAGNSWINILLKYNRRC